MHFSQHPENPDFQKTVCFSQTKVAFNHILSRLRLKYAGLRALLTLDVNQLSVLTPVEYLARNVTLETSRRQLFDKVFTRNKSHRDGLLTEEGLVKVQHTENRR
jgi:hypothetical protein